MNNKLKLILSYMFWWFNLGVMMYGLLKGFLLYNPGLFFIGIIASCFNVVLFYGYAKSYDVWKEGK